MSEGRAELGAELAKAEARAAELMAQLAEGKAKAAALVKLMAYLEANPDCADVLQDILDGYWANRPGARRPHYEGMEART